MSFSKQPKQNLRLGSGVNVLISVQWTMWNHLPVARICNSVILLLLLYCLVEKQLYLEKESLNCSHPAHVSVSQPGSKTNSLMGDVFCTSISCGDNISDSDTFLLGFDISFVPGEILHLELAIVCCQQFLNLWCHLALPFGWYQADIIEPGTRLCSGRRDMSNENQNPDKPGFRFSEQITIFRWKPAFLSKFI